MKAGTRYELIRRIAKGGMAEVFLAKLLGAHGFEKLVAIKKLLPHLRDQSNFARMFIEEAKLASRLAHPNIVQVHELGMLGEDMFIAMEFVDGADMVKLARRAHAHQLRMSPILLAYVANQVATGLSYAHSLTGSNGKLLGLVHLDVSPHNVMISAEGEVKITDFGIAKATAALDSVTKTRQLAGKMAYMSPEQAYGLPVDQRSDIFSLGVMLYELLAGRRLFVGESDLDTLERVRRAEVPPLPAKNGVPESLQSIVLKALAREPSDRYQRASELAQDLLEVLTEQGHSLSGKELGAVVRKLFPDRISKSDGLDARKNSASTKSALVVAKPIKLPPPEVPSLRGAARSPAPESESVPVPLPPPPALQPDLRQPAEVGVAINHGMGRPMGRYILEKQLGAGGMGITYLATRRGEAGFEKKVVIKKLMPRFAREPELIQTLIDEAKTAVLLTHPNIVGIYDLGREGDEYYIAMEYVRGRDLASLMASDGGVPPYVLIHAVMQILQALEYAHSYTHPNGRRLGVIHRDLSPENILISYDGTVKITDFGIAKIRNKLSYTLPGTVKGKCGYLSPEQAASRELDHRTDLYQVGIVLYEGLTGDRLYPGKTELETMKLAAQGEVTPIRERVSEIDATLESIVHRALAKDPDDRFQSAEEFYDAIAAFVLPMTQQSLRRATRDYLLIVSGMKTGSNGGRTPSSDLSITGSASWIYVLTQDSIFEQGIRELLDDPWAIKSASSGRYRFIFVDSQEELEEARENIQRLQRIPSAVIFGPLSVALEEPLLSELKNQCTAKLLVTGQPQSEIMFMAANLCGLDGVLQAPFALDDVIRCLEPMSHSGSFRSRVMALQNQVENLRSCEYALRTEMSAVAEANVRAMELLEEIQKRDGVIRQKDDLIGKVARAVVHTRQDLSMDVEARDVYLQGDFSDLSIIELIELLKLGRKTATVTVQQGSVEGYFELMSGEITDARLAHERGENALQKLMSWRAGSFTVHSSRGTRQRTIHRATDEVLMDMLADGADDLELNVDIVVGE